MARKRSGVQVPPAPPNFLFLKVMFKFLKYFLFISLIGLFILTFVLGGEEDLLLKLAKENEEKYLKNPDKSYISWNIAVDYYTKLYQVYGYTELREKLIKLHIDGALINSKNLNFFNFHYGYSSKYPIKITVLNLTNYPKFDYYIFDKVLPLFITIYNNGDKNIDLSKAIINLENISNIPEKTLNNEDIFRRVLGDDLVYYPISKVLKSQENFSFILLFTYNSPPKIFRFTYQDVEVNVIFFENIPLIESSSPKA